MEVMQWEVLLRSARKRCENTNTRSCWRAPVIKEERDDVPDLLISHMGTWLPILYSKALTKMLEIDRSGLELSVVDVKPARIS